MIARTIMIFCINTHGRMVAQASRLCTTNRRDARSTGFLSILLCALTLCTLTAPSTAREPIVCGSKKFTESVILGEIAAHLARSAGVPAKHNRDLGGTRIVFNALRSGQIDIYAEYTGTITQEILRDLQLNSLNDIRQALAERGISTTDPLGFNNSYAIGMLEQRAEALNINTISDLRDHPDLALAFSNEFIDRGDGWNALKRHYNLPHDDVRGIDHDLAYRALNDGVIDAMDLYTTDAEIAYYDLRLLRDDQSFFRDYQALYLYRTELEQTHPEVVDMLRSMAGRLDADTMRGLNKQVKLGGRSESVVAGEFVNREYGYEVQTTSQSLVDRIWRHTIEHLFLVGVSMAAGIAIAIPLGVLAARVRRFGQLILAIVGIIQTIPALALLVFMIPLFGLYAPPAIAALFLYSLLPMVRNTHAGLTNIPPSIEESAEALGLSAWARLIHVDVPIASPSILAGVKTSMVINIGFATLGALIGAGGYGQPIFTGIRLDDFALICTGAVPAVALALAAQGGFEVLERIVVPRGLRLRRAA